MMMPAVKVDTVGDSVISEGVAIGEGAGFAAWDAPISTPVGFFILLTAHNAIAIRANVSKSG